MGIGRKWIGSKILIVWNFVGLAFLANAFLTALHQALAHSISIGLENRLPLLQHGR